ncbi:MAG TPA: bifunctional [glutamate--ammonia ligase]-adenylyl-L-tyrosine phosphorylase/[glutamate--ammonia-ligase] adenylyltransferase [Pseudomonadales bacterium]|nr:bifunctional [glutamate--ammonia ligase]-adenylyl-L-tyrosine phosphorylase/[glutamate--ammonia-ligase] adenylyltransferase [Pseudomonadales bacterium]
MEYPVLLLPEEEQGEFLRLQQTFIDKLDAENRVWFSEKQQDSVFISELARVWIGSQFVFDWCCRQPQWLRELFEESSTGVLLVDRQPLEKVLALELGVLLSTVDSEEALMRVLRLFRQQQMIRIIWRDITRRAVTLETTAALSALADISVRSAVDFLYPRLCSELGEPCSESGQPQSFLVLGMGKLGAFELNLSSDIDLIFAYDESGETNGRRPVMNRDFFTRLGQKLIAVIDKPTVDGFVFRVDMRLRPYGDSGALALNYDAMEQYYQQQGRDWERYAMIKVRLIVGNEKQAAPLMDMLRRFTFRRYLDFAAIAALRDLKCQIEREMAKRGMNDNVKLGQGGIREIEFIVQSFQLVHGGRDRDLQPAPVIPMLSQLESKGFMAADDVACLKNAYYFLRDTEHLLQAWRDEQTQMLPRDDKQKWRLAWLLGFSCWDNFYKALQEHRSNVQRIFTAVIAPLPEEKNTEQENQWQYLWESAGDGEVTSIELQNLGFQNAALLQPLLTAWHGDKSLMVLPTEGRERLNRFMPLLLKELSNSPQPDVVFARLLPLLRAVLRRSAYLVLLIESAHAFKQLVLLVAASSWIAEQLAAAPVLLDELIDPRNLYRDIAPSREELRNLLLAQMSHIPEDDLEAQMEALRHFKRSHSLRAAACEVTGRLSLMKVSDYLTFLAEVILAYVLQMVWKPLTQKHGVPQHEDGSACDPGFVIVGYGKLGGLELGHGSDLDLVFIHDAVSGETVADSAMGQVTIENSVFFARLGQKIIHILNARTVNGILYEVDMRLRPSGNSGLLVASLKSFERYQENDAWTWEHQALVRTRVVAGCPSLAEKFAAVRARVLGRQRDTAQLAREVVDMRNKMREQLDSKDPAVFDLKQGVGGIVDLEFLVQYAVLAWGHAYPDLLIWTDNIRILEQLAASNALSLRQAEDLMEAYRVLRGRGHRCVLLGLPARLPASELIAERALIQQVWQQVFSSLQT